MSGSSFVRAWLMAGSDPIALVESTVNAWLALLHLLPFLIPFLEH